MPILKKYVWILVLSNMGALGCYRTSKSIETDTGTDADADADTDADTDADADSDMDIAPDCADGQGRLDDETGLCWQHPATAPERIDWQEAVDYCQVLTLGGHSDWRLPSNEDFIDILGGCDSDLLESKHGNCNTCVESANCTALFGPDEGWYWSSAPSDDWGPWYALFDVGYVGWSDGYHSTIDKEGSNVRCVRVRDRINNLVITPSRAGGF